MGCVFDPLELAPPALIVLSFKMAHDMVAMLDLKNADQMWSLLQHARKGSVFTTACVDIASYLDNADMGGKYLVATTATDSFIRQRRHPDTQDGDLLIRVHESLASIIVPDSILTSINIGFGVESHGGMRWTVIYINPPSPNSGFIINRSEMQLP